MIVILETSMSRRKSCPRFNERHVSATNVINEYDGHWKVLKELVERREVERMLVKDR